jgi:superfamily II DNA/RNA helicase
VLTQTTRNQAAALGLKAPTEIQAQVIPEIIKGGHVVMASHTGSGKTLAYLLPVVRRARRTPRQAPPAAAWARVR